MTGTCTCPDRPGLGVDLVEEEMEKHPGITTDAPDNFYI